MTNKIYPRMLKRKTLGYTHYTDTKATQLVYKRFDEYIEYIKTALEEKGLTVVVCDPAPRNGQCANFDLPDDIKTFWEWMT